MWEGYIEPNSSIEIPEVNGFVYVRNSYSFGGYLLYYATFGVVELILNPAGYDIKIGLTHNSNGILTVKNISEGKRRIEVYYQTLML